MVSILKYDVNLIIVEEKPKSNWWDNEIIVENKYHNIISSLLNFVSINAVTTNNEKLLEKVYSQVVYVGFNAFKFTCLLLKNELHL